MRQSVPRLPQAQVCASSCIFVVASSILLQTVCGGRILTERSSAVLVVVPASPATRRDRRLSNFMDPENYVTSVIALRVSKLAPRDLSVCFWLLSPFMRGEP